MSDYLGNDIDGFMSDDALKWLYNMAESMNTIAEIGSWKGRSTHALLSGCKGTVYAIDHFLGSEEFYIESYEAKCNFNQQVKQFDIIYNEFIKNVGHFPNLIINRKSSTEAAKDYPDKFFDMVFIDGGHIYSQVKNDIKAWKPKTKILLCGHDYRHIDDVYICVNEEFTQFGSIKGDIWYKWAEDQDFLAK